MFAVLSVCVVAGSALSRSLPGESAIRALYPQVSRAIEAKDPVALGRFLAPSWYLVDPTSGKVSRNDALAEFGRQYQPFTKIKDVYKVTRVTREGATLVAEYTETMRAVASDGHRDHNVLVVNKGIDSWKRFGVTWKMTSSALVETTVTVDGTVMQHATAHIKNKAGVLVQVK